MNIYTLRIAGRARPSGSVAQRLERVAVNHKVEGSIPSGTERFTLLTPVFACFCSLVLLCNQLTCASVHLLWAPHEHCALEQEPG